MGIANLLTTADLRIFAEELAGKAEILSLPRNEALLHVYRYAQTAEVVDTIRHFRSGNVHYSYDRMRDTQDILRWITFKIFDKCSPGGDISVRTGPNAIQSAKDSLKKFRLFSELQDAILSVEAGLYLMEIEDGGAVVRFRHPDKYRTLRLRRNYAAFLERKAEIWEVGRKVKESSPGNHRFKKITVSGDGTEFDLTFTGGLARQLCSELPVPKFELPAELSVGPYTMGNIEDVWRHLMCRLSICQTVLQMIATDQWNGNWTAHNSAAMVIEVERLVGELVYHRSLSRVVARKIVDDLTYSPTVPDVMYQPLIPLDSQHLMTIPSLITGSNPERNFLAIVDRLSHIDSVAIKDIREDMMIGDIEDVASDCGLCLRSHINLPRPGCEDLVGEIDLVLWAEGDSTYALAISLKWFYGADSIHEVRQQDKRVADGLKQHDICLEYLRQFPEETAGRYEKLPNWDSCTVFEGVLVSKVDLPSELVEIVSIPVVTLERFLVALRDAGPNLRAVYNEMLTVASGGDYPKVEFEVDSKKFEADGYAFYFPVARPARS